MRVKLLSYKATADVLEKKGQMTLPPIELRFPAWHTAELLQDGKIIPIGSIEFKCEPLSYPLSLMVHSRGSISLPFCPYGAPLLFTASSYHQSVPS